MNGQIFFMTQFSDLSEDIIWSIFGGRANSSGAVAGGSGASLYHKHSEKSGIVKENQYPFGSCNYELQAMITPEMQANDMFFKEETSLSKAWNLTERFSEDIELSTYPSWKMFEYNRNSQVILKFLKSIFFVCLHKTKGDVTWKKC